MSLSHEPIYFVWCANCGFEIQVRKRLWSCPECNTSLHEKTYLF